MRTTIDINDALLRQVKEQAGKSGLPLKQIFQQLLVLGLSQVDRATAPKKFRVKTHPLGLKAAFRGQSMNQIYDQMEAEDSAR
jgi:hypothetical protein